MAGVRITDLGTLTTAVDADLLYIVDVSDTSQSPQGTSKQIELGNVASSGTWTPEASNYLDCSNAVFNIALYTKVGNTVNCAIYGTLDFSSTTGCSLTFTLPFTTTDSFAIGVASTNIDNNGVITPYLSNAFLILNTGNQSGSLNFSAVFTFLIN
jgi:hypothetical protein